MRLPSPATICERDSAETQTMGTSLITYMAYDTIKAIRRK